MSAQSASSKKIRKLSWLEIWDVTKTTFAEFFKERSFFHGAALAYYTVFAMIPMIYLSLISFGRFVGQDTMLKIIDRLLREEVGLIDSSGIMSFLGKVNFEKGNIWLNTIGIVALILSSSALLASLRTSINDFFDVEVQVEGRKKLFLHHLWARLANVVLLPVLGVVVIVTYFGETILLSLGQNVFAEESIWNDFLMGTLEHVAAIATNVLLFAVIFKYLHDAKVAWKLAFSGAIATALLLYIGQLLIRFYLKNYFFGSSIGMPGTLLIILAWMYYSSQIIFLGAKFTKVYGDKVGKPIAFKPRRWVSGNKNP